MSKTDLLKRTDAMADVFDTWWDRDEITTEESAKISNLFQELSTKLMEREDAFKSYCPNMTEYHNGYAQAQADGVGKPLTDDKDVQIVIDMQKKRLGENKERIKKLEFLLEFVHDWRESGCAKRYNS